MNIRPKYPKFSSFESEVLMTEYFDALGEPHSIPAGVAPKWRISGYALVREGHSILMVVPPWDGLFHLPGGMIEPEERLIVGTARECLEETGYKVRIDSEWPLHFLEQNFYTRSTQEYCHSLSYFFFGTLVDRVQDVSALNKTAVRETERVEWVSQRALTTENCHPMFYPFLKSIQL